MALFSIKDIGDRIRRLADHAVLIAGQTSAGKPVPVHLSDDGSIAVEVMVGAAPSLFRKTDQGFTKTSIKAGAGNLQGYNFINPNTYPVYVKLYDALVGSVTVGTTIPKRTLAVAANGFLFNENAGPSITVFATGITIAVTKLLADTDTTVLDTPILAEVQYS